MNIVRSKPLAWWQSCGGLCVICGTPMSIEPERKLVKEKYENGETLVSYVDDDDIETSAKKTSKLKTSVAKSKLVPTTTASSSSEPLEDEQDEQDEVILFGGGDAATDLIEENFVRVGLFKYNLLGKMDKCHLIDSYTFLDKLNEFLKLLQECRKLVTDLGGDLEKDLKDNNKIYEKASDYCQRVANKILVPGCKGCNLAMARHVAHGDIVYRCYPQSADLNIPELEDSMSKNIRKGNKMKRVLQQIALFFKLEANGHWKARDEVEIMPLASLWRCVANLCLWGKGGMARHRLVAIFYAGVILYERMRMKDIMLLVDWHMHVFRVFYMQEVAHATFFGMEHHQVAVSFDTTYKAGPVWCSIVEHHLEWAKDKLETFMSTQLNMRQVTRFKDTMSLYISTEKALFSHLCRRAGARHGVESIMAYYMYNFKDPRAMLLYTRGKLFKKEMIRAVDKEMRSASSLAMMTMHHNFTSLKLEESTVVGID